MSPFGRRLKLYARYRNAQLLQRIQALSERVSGRLQSYSASLVLQQASESTMKLMRSSAFAHMMQSLLQNYTEFVIELGQSGMAMVSQTQAAMIRQTQEAPYNVIDVTEARGSRARRAV